MSDEIKRTLDERGSRYGDWTDNAQIGDDLLRVVARYDNWLVGLSPAQRQSITLVFQKIARIVNGDPDYEDNWVDIIGYTQLALDRIRMGKDVATGEEEIEPKMYPSFAKEYAPGHTWPLSTNIAAQQEAQRQRYQDYVAQHQQQVEPQDKSQTDAPFCSRDILYDRLMSGLNPCPLNNSPRTYYNKETNTDVCLVCPLRNHV